MLRLLGAHSRRDRQERGHAGGIVVCAIEDVPVAHAEVIVVRRDYDVAGWLALAGHDSDDVDAGAFARPPSRKERERTFECASDGLDASLLEALHEEGARLRAPWRPRQAAFHVVGS